MSTEQWRELATKPITMAGVNNYNYSRLLRDALIAAADACDQLTHARNFHFEAANRYCNENTALRELLATARKALYHAGLNLNLDGCRCAPGSYQCSRCHVEKVLAAIDAATKETS